MHDLDNPKGDFDGKPCIILRGVLPCVDDRVPLPDLGLAAHGSIPPQQAIRPPYQLLCVPRTKSEQFVAVSRLRMLEVGRNHCPGKRVFEERELRHLHALSGRTRRVVPVVEAQYVRKQNANPKSRHRYTDPR
jgi:hypothetical protein